MPSSVANLQRKLYSLLVLIVRFLTSTKFHGQGRICPICTASSKSFLPFGRHPRPEAQCWKCHSLERHRFFWQFFTSTPEITLKENQKLLHVAPEACLRLKLQQYVGDGYLTADLLAKNVDVKMDITDIKFPDGHFDAIYCSHVLEHVLDDRKAIREFFRVLKPGGWAILLVPIIAEETFEDASIRTPEARLKAFGQEDHVRNYGPDYIERLLEADFLVETFSPIDILAASEIKTLGLGMEAGEIFLCRKK
ncbi:MAG: SAM-dependent methyltransferase [Halioglobus sp.]|jgi:SAM-dependent methyltransferase